MDTFAKALEDAVKAAHAPGAVAYVGDGTGALYFGAYGQRQCVPSAEATDVGTLYDLASLTKVLATTTAVLMLRDEGALDLDQPVAEIVPVPAFGHFTIRHCLTHTTGLDPGIAFQGNQHSQRDPATGFAERPEYEAGSRRVYSDLGFIILGKVVEIISGDSLDAFCGAPHLRPAGHEQDAVPPAGGLGVAVRGDGAVRVARRGDARLRARRDGVGEQGRDGPRGPLLLRGRHGAFLQSPDVSGGCCRRRRWRNCRGSIRCLRYPWQGLGWKIDPWSSGSEGFLPSRTAIGHTGSTGTSVWLDLTKGVFAILLGNTCHPSREARNNLAFRRTFHAPLALFFSRRPPYTHRA